MEDLLLSFVFALLVVIMLVTVFTCIAIAVTS